MNDDFNPYILIPVGIFAWMIAFFMVGISKLVDLARERRASRVAGTAETARKLLPSRRRIWWWIFLSLEAAFFGSLAVAVYQSSLGNRYIDLDRHPIRGGVVFATLTVIPMLLLGISPFFFRTMGFVAILAWITGVIAVLWPGHPIF